jgi:hypothetical protein
METLSQIIALLGMKGIIIIAVSVLVVLLIIYLISLKTGKGINIELGPIKLHTSSKKVRGDETRIGQIKTILEFERRNEAESSLLDTLVDFTKSKTREKDIIELQTTVINQMNYAEDFNIQIKSLMTQTYANLLKSKCPEIESKQHRDYKYYQVLVTSILDEVKRNVLRQSLKGMDIATISTQDFESFISQKSDVMITLIVDYIDLMYQSTIVTNDEVRNENVKLTRPIKEAYRTLYYNIRNIIMDDKKAIEKIDNDLNANVHNIKNQFSKGCVANKIEDVITEKKES